MVSPELIRVGAAAALLTGGYTEITTYWKYPKTGLPCRARPDYLNDDMTLVVDLKTCASAAPEAFSRAVNNYRYHVQDGWYRNGLKMLGCPVEHFVFICVENTPPYAIETLRLPNWAYKQSYSELEI